MYMEWDINGLVNGRNGDICAKADLVPGAALGSEVSLSSLLDSAAIQSGK